MDLIEISFLALIILLGIITSYGDVKFGKIRNKWIIIFGAVGIFLNLIIFLNLYIVGVLNLPYIFEFFSNLALAFLIGFLFYYFDIWSAGDGKLFGVFAILIPLSIYSVGYINFFPSLIFLINIFLIAFFVMAFSLVINIFKKRVPLEHFRKKLFTGIRMKIFNSAIQIFLIMWVVEVFLKLINIDVGFYVRFLLMFVLLGASGTILSKYNKILLACVGLRLIFDWSIYSWDFLLQFLIYLFVFRFLMGLGNNTLEYFSNLFFSKKMSARELKKGIVLSDVIVAKDKLSKKTQGELIKQNIEFVRFEGKYYIKYPKGESIEEGIFDSIMLHKEDVNLLKNLGFKKYSISEVTPFAFFIFFGALVTYFMKGTIFSFIKGLL